MNKNWLYRVLAMALIVMMAMPFAMAEEVQAVDDVQANAVEEVVENEAFDLSEAAEAVESNGIEADATFDELDGEDWDKVVLGDTIYVEIGTDAYKYKIISKRTNNSKRAKISTVDKEDGLFKITLKDNGKVKLTVKYKEKDDEDDGWSSTKTAEAEINVKGGIEKVKLYMGDGALLTDEDDAIDENPFEVDMGYYEGVSIIPFAVDGDGNVLDYEAEESEYVDDNAKEDKWGLYTFKWSNTSVGCFENEDGKKVNNKTWSTEEISELVPVFYKPGKTKLTVTSKYDTKKKTSVTFKVTGVDSYKGSKPSKKDDVVYFRVKSAKFTEFNKGEVELYIVNGGAKKIKKTALFGIQIVDENGEPLFEKDKVYFPAVAGGKSTTFKIKFENDEVAMPTDIHYAKLNVDEIVNLEDYIGIYEPISNDAE